MKKVKLLPEQVKIIEREIGTLETQIRETIECLMNCDNKHMSSSNNQGFDGIPDIISFQALGRLRNKLNELNEILRNAEIVDTYDNEKIEVGTKFVATLKRGNQMTTEKYILVDGIEHLLELLSSEYHPVSINSPLGQAVRGKGENEVITYVSVDGLVVGLIDSIVPISKKTISEDGKKLTK